MAASPPPAGQPAGPGGAPAPPPFDPRTGDWVLVPAVPWPGPAGSAPPGPPPAIGDRRQDRTSRVWDAILWVDLGLLGLLLLAAAVFTLLMGNDVDLPTPDGSEGATPQAAYWALWAQCAMLFPMEAVVPVAWGWSTRVGGFRGMVAYFELGRPAMALGKGLLLGFLVLGALVAVVAGLDALGYRPENPQAEAIEALVDWPLAFALSLTAALGEELVFRGVLQKRIGLWPQAVLFGLVHASYGTVLQLAVPFVLGVLLGYAVKRGHGLWTAIGAHFVFDFVQLGLAVALGGSGGAQ